MVGTYGWLKGYKLCTCSHRAAQGDLEQVTSRLWKMGEEGWRNRRDRWRHRGEERGRCNAAQRIFTDI